VHGAHCTGVTGSGVGVTAVPVGRVVVGARAGEVLVDELLVDELRVDVVVFAGVWAPVRLEAVGWPVQPAATSGRANATGNPMANRKSIRRRPRGLGHMAQAVSRTPGRTPSTCSPSTRMGTPLTNTWAMPTGASAVSRSPPAGKS